MSTSHTPGRTPSPESHKKQRIEQASSSSTELPGKKVEAHTMAGATGEATIAAPSGQTAGSGNDDSAAQRPAPRVIDENTDMSTLTDQEIMRLMEGMDHTEDVLDKPLISAPVPLMVIRDEYITGSQQVVKKLDWLQEHGWDQIWRARGDGDCFYRSFTIAYILRILHSPDPALAANLAFEAIQRAKPAESTHFDPELYEEFLSPMLELVRAFAPEDPDAALPTQWDIVQALQDPERSNSVVVALRLMTSAYIRTHPDTFAPFLLSPTTFLPLTPDDFCRQEIEPCGKEADHAQIMALAEALSIGIRIAYLDRSEVKVEEGGEVINWVEFGVGTGEDDRPLTLLYRPGHFDVVTRDVLPTDVPDI